MGQIGHFELHNKQDLCLISAKRLNGMQENTLELITKWVKGDQHRKVSQNSKPYRNEHDKQL